MTTLETKFDLTLLGYRNDLSRERTLAFLHRLPEARGGPVDLHRDAPLPRTILEGLDHATGLQLVTELRQRGAQVSLRGYDSELQQEPVEPPTPSERGAHPLQVAFIAIAATLVLFAAARTLQVQRPALAPTAASQFATALSSGNVPLQRHRLNQEAVDLNAAGQFEEAAQRLYDAIERAPGEQVLYANLLTVLRNWAVAEINAGRPERAVDLLDEALEIRGEPSLLALLGIAQERLGTLHDAAGNLEKAVQLGNSEPMTFVALGRVYRKQGDQQGAAEMFQRARETGAHGTDFEAMLKRIERELDAEWDFVDFNTPHFRISFAQGENREAAHIVSQVLEDAYFSVGRKLDLFPATPTDVVLYPSEDFHTVTQTPDWTGGVFDGRIKLPVGGVAGRSPLLERTVRHEYGHVLVTKLGNGHVPVWLNEGLAIWAEEQEDGDHEPWAYATISGQRLFSLGDLLPPFTRLPADRVQVAYAQSYLAVRLIIANYGERRLLDLLRSTGNGDSIETSFENVLSTSIATFESRLIGALTS